MRSSSFAAKPRLGIENVDALVIALGWQNLKSGDGGSAWPALAAVANAFF